MIIQCKSCSRKFIVKDRDIPKSGREVKCGYCSVTWHQMPVREETETNKRNFASNKGRSVRFIIIHFSVTECFKHGQHPYTGF